jgi:predicted ArsR family transcriptional regulator
MSASTSKSKRTTTQRVESAVRKDRPTTIASVSKSSGVPVGQARLVLEVLAEVGRIEKIGVKTTGKRGRPAFLFQRGA